MNKPAWLGKYLFATHTHLHVWETMWGESLFETYKVWLLFIQKQQIMIYKRSIHHDTTPIYRYCTTTWQRKDHQWENGGAWNQRKHCSRDCPWQFVTRHWHSLFHWIRICGNDDNKPFLRNREGKKGWLRLFTRRDPLALAFHRSLIFKATLKQWSCNKMNGTFPAFNDHARLGMWSS